MTQQEFLELHPDGEIINGWLTYGEYLDCSYNKLTSLPDNLEVGRSLYCYNNKLTSLPDNLEVGGGLYCYNNKLTSLPDKLKVRESLYCYNNKLTSLPDNLEVGGSLDCYNNKLTSLPDKLKVRESLYCYNNKLTEVPEYIEDIEHCYIFDGLNWNDPVWINKILKDELTAEEVFAIDNIEHRRVAFEYMDKGKMRDLKDFKVLDEVEDDGKGNSMKIVSFNIQDMEEDLLFLNVFCPSTGREYFLQTDQEKCWKAKNGSFGLDDVEWINEW